MGTAESQLGGLYMCLAFPMSCAGRELRKGLVSAAKNVPQVKICYLPV